MDKMLKTIHFLDLQKQINQWDLVLSKFITLSLSIELRERIQWWKYILGEEINTDYKISAYGFDSVNELDEYVKVKYAKELKHPEIVARILGSKDVL